MREIHEAIPDLVTSLAGLLLDDLPFLSVAVTHDRTKAFLSRHPSPNPPIVLHPKAYLSLHHEGALGYDSQNLRNATSVV